MPTEAAQSQEPQTILQNKPGRHQAHPGVTGAVELGTMVGLLPPCSIPHTAPHSSVSKGTQRAPQDMFTLGLSQQALPGMTSAITACGWGSLLMCTQPL